jgi:SanA protein
VSGRIKRATWILAGLVLSAAIAVILCHGLVARAASGRCFDQPDHLPAHEVALVLGCSRNTAHGWSNPFFEHRIHAAASLYRSGKVRYFIVSGDNSRPGYDEPSDMKQALVERGVPADRIYRDFAGLRTLDSVVRAREIFGVTGLAKGCASPSRRQGGIYTGTPGVVAASLCRGAEGEIQAQKRRHAGTAAWLQH